MRRYHLVAVAGLGLAVYAGLLHSRAGLLAAVAGVVAAFALGVMCPRLRFFGPFICRGDRSRDRVAITFNGGPDPRSTPQLLELLHQRRVPATFFCVGRLVAEHPSLAAQMFREGHLLENHSQTQSKAMSLFSYSRLESELKQAQAAIQQATGVAPRFYRPPFGCSNPRMFRAASAAGLTVVGWTANGFDTMDANPERIVKRLARRLRPGAIIQLNDADIPADRLVATVKVLLDTAHSQGYEVVRLDRLLP